MSNTYAAEFPIFFTPPCEPKDRQRRLYGGGGGGGDGGAAARKATEDSRVARAIDSINASFGVGEDNAQQDSGRVMDNIRGGSRGGSLFGPRIFDIIGQIGQRGRSGIETTTKATRAATMAGREKLYAGFGEDTKNTAMQDLNKDRDIMQRDIGFSLARQGLSGGSRDIDLGRDIMDRYQQGVLKAADMGLSVTNNARMADDRTRIGLINSVRSGLDQGSAQQQAYESMTNNARQASDNAKNTNLAGFFDSMRGLQQEYNYNQGLKQGQAKYGGKSGGGGDGTKQLTVGG